jgi:hypothetical protein
MKPEILIKSRLQSRDKEFANSVNALLRNEAARSGGVALSGNIIGGGYNLLVDELKLNVELICGGFKDSLVGTFSRNATNNFDVMAKSILVNRKNELETLYIENMKAVLQTSEDKIRFAEYFSLDRVFDSQLLELSIAVSKIEQEYQNSLGKNLLERVKNEFNNRPLVVVAVITIAAVSTVLTFLKIIGDFKY